jgi:hypothetical protein
MPARHTRPILLPFFGLLLAGCGVAEYEARMKEAQERVKRYEEESKLLAAPVKPPAAKNESGQLEAVASFTLRLPNTVSTQPSPEARGGLYYDYMPATIPPMTAYPWVSLAFAKADDAKFPEAVMKWFTATGPVNVTPHTTRLKVPFSRTTFENDTHWHSINLYKGSNQQVAIIYVVPKAQRQQAARAIDLSLDSFGIESSLAAARQAYEPKGLLDREVPR